MSTDDVLPAEEVEHINIEEKILEEELEEEGDLENLENLRKHEKKDPQN